MTAQTAHAAPSTTTTDNAGHATRRKVLWGAQILLAAFLLIGSGLPKLVGQADAVETFELIGWGQWFRYVTGVIEVTGAIALVIPRLAGLAATALIGLMAGAILTQILVIEPAWSILPAAFAVVFATIAWDRRTETRELLRSLKR
ncbi:DoxX family protein [Actinomadura bangladeshensis]|uniref:DoxX family protein n=1 Tax=Actinomadura bangladeshensis TaxID=453573 RepID=A0A6L9QD68_9ACTN|nr:DoxX family protein [Actinomadura bangladeshensis]NEA23042.1 DoxX family protein [Actinomadura bangladeshensis]